ncbi:MAG: hypothetical protein LBS91_04815 [Clostridiales Family XIII bacterium]|jgi:hypothetical protein|nr:hypothetical protein [Clostridiales Family XIII bacterium]
MSHWEKFGCVYTLPENLHPKMLSHVGNPLPVRIQGDVYRIFFSARDEKNRSSVGAVDFDIVRRAVVREHGRPFFLHGPEGSFYADGVSIGNCYTAGGVTYMLFMGWQTGGLAHWRGDIGRLVLHDDLSLSLDSEQAFLRAGETDPVSLSYPWVHQKRDGAFLMWYGSTETWDAGNGDMLHVINYATSADGQSWARGGLAVPYALGKAQAFSRPTVVQNERGDYEMWFSYRSGSGQKYRIGHTASEDGMHWTPAPGKSGIDVSAAGWDSEMIEYPFVFDHGGKRYMLYNGNAFGKTGFGLAVLGHE